MSSVKSPCGAIRFRGLPRHLHPGFQVLSVDPNSEISDATGMNMLLGPCQGCNFVHYRHLLLACGHVLCEDCVLYGKRGEVIDSGVQDAGDTDLGEHEQPDRFPVRCGVCYEQTVAHVRHIDSIVLDSVRLYCQCGYKGTLEQLSCHNWTCDGVKQSLNDHKTAESPGSIGSGSACRGSASPELNDAPVPLIDLFELRTVLFEEVRRLEEDVMNRIEVKRVATETRLEKLEENMLTKANRTSISELLETLQLDIERATTYRDFVYRSGHKLFWFNIKHLVEKHCSTGIEERSPVQSRLIGGYPLEVYVSVVTETYQCLGVFVGPCALQHSADWPMKREIFIRVYDGLGESFCEFSFKTTSKKIESCFKGPHSGFRYGTHNICSISDITQTTFYKRQTGMVGIGVEVNPL